jgi:hypothetical protein
MADTLFKDGVDKAYVAAVVQLNTTLAACLLGSGAATRACRLAALLLRAASTTHAKCEGSHSRSAASRRGARADRRSAFFSCTYFAV